jgi:hypothetical protein
MKLLTNIVLVCFALASTAFAQFERPNGFAEIPWGTKLSEAKKLMLAKPGIYADIDTTASRLGFKGGTFAAKPAVVWGLEFVDGGLYRGAVVLKAFTDRSKEFDSVKDMLTKKYGRPTSTSRKDKDSKAIWKFLPDSRSKDIEVIELWNNPKEEGVKITYRNESMKAGNPSDEL